MLRLTTLALIASCAALAPSASAKGAALAGVYASPGYGYVFVARGRRIDTYDVSSAGCVKGPRYKSAAFYGFYGTPEMAADGKSGALLRSPTRDAIHKLDRLPAECQKPLKGAGASVNLDALISTFDQYYPFFKERGVDWPQASAAARARASAGEGLFDIIVSLMAPLNDGHVTLSAGERSYDPDIVVAPQTGPDGAAWTAKSYRTALRDYVQGPQTPLAAPAVFAAERRLLFGKTADGVGYVAIFAEGGWGAGETEEMPTPIHVASAARILDEILPAFADAKGLIVDLRANSGGFDAVSLEIASRFAKSETLAYRKKDAASAPYDVFVVPSTRARFEGPVAVLIGPNTVSAGESLAAAFAALPQARLFGRPTRGIFSDAVPRTLPNGWTYTLSVESAYAPDGTLLEVTGVSPDVTALSPVSASPADLFGGDIAAALGWLKSRQ